MKIICKNEACKNIWDYKGAALKYAICPKCRTSNSIPNLREKADFERTLESIRKRRIMLDEYEAETKAKLEGNNGLPM